MKNIIFEKIRLQNFLSFGNEPTELTFENGITFISGTDLDKDSKNGVGKTALIIESLSYVLFGATYRKIPISDIPNWDTGEPCVVQLWFRVNEDHYHIIRSANPSKLFLYKNPQNFEEIEKADISRTIPETNKDIIDIIGISKDIFTNTLVLTNKTTAFIEQDKQPKIKFIEGILSLEIFSRLLEKAKALYTEQDKEVDKTTTIVDQLRKNLEQDKKYSESFEQTTQQNISKIKQDIVILENIENIDNSKKILELEKEIEPISTEIKELEDKYQKIQVKLAEFKSDIKNEKSNLAKFEESVCPTCKRPLDNHDKKEIEIEKGIVSKKIEDLAVSLAKYTAASEKAYKLIGDKRVKKQTIERNISLLKQEQEKYTINQTKIKTMSQNIEDLLTQPNPFIQKISDNEKELNLKEQILRELMDKLKVLDLVKIASSPNGIKALVIKRIIKVMNERINFYLRRLKAPVAIEFDEFFEDTIIELRTKKNILYGSLSGGEGKRLDFSMLFAFRDIRRLQSGVTMNISVFDELFDSALDGKAMQDIMTLLQEMSSHEGFYIITHRESNLELDGCNLISIEKKDGISKIIST